MRWQIRPVFIRRSACIPRTMHRDRYSLPIYARPERTALWSARPASKTNPAVAPLSLMGPSIATRVWSISSKRAGLPVFLLADGRATLEVATRRHVNGAHSARIASSKPVAAQQVQQCEGALRFLHLQPGLDQPHVARPDGGGASAGTDVARLFQTQSTQGSARQGSTGRDCKASIGGARGPSSTPRGWNIDVYIATPNGREACPWDGLSC
jgi:hypothetical protein